MNALVRLSPVGATGKGLFTTLEIDFPPYK
jgi:hypothetical protein